MTNIYRCKILAVAFWILAIGSGIAMKPALEILQGLDPKEGWKTIHTLVFEGKYHKPPIRYDDLDYNRAATPTDEKIIFTALMRTIQVAADPTEAFAQDIEYLQEITGNKQGLRDKTSRASKKFLHQLIATAATVSACKTLKGPKTIETIQIAATAFANAAGHDFSALMKDVAGRQSYKDALAEVQKQKVAMIAAPQPQPTRPSVPSSPQVSSKVPDQEHVKRFENYLTQAFDNHGKKKKSTSISLIDRYLDGEESLAVNAFYARLAETLVKEQDLIAYDVLIKKVSDELIYEGLPADIGNTLRDTGFDTYLQDYLTKREIILHAIQQKTEVPYKNTTRKQEAQYLAAKFLVYKKTDISSGQLNQQPSFDDLASAINVVLKEERFEGPTVQRALGVNFIREVLKIYADKGINRLLGEFPQDMRSNIFSYLSLEDLKGLKCTSKDMKKMIENEGHIAANTDPINVVVVGAAGAGKSTLITYLAGHTLVAIDDQDPDFPLFYLDPQSPLPGIKVEHNGNPGTTDITSFHDKTTNIMYWDCPGFSNLGEKEYHRNKVSLHDLFKKLPRAKILFVVSRFSMDLGYACTDRGVVEYFSDTFNEVVGITQDNNQLFRAISLVIPSTGKMDIAEIKETLQRFLEGRCHDRDDQISKKPRIKALFQFLMDNASEKISLFPKPKAEGPYSSEYRQTILDKIHSSGYIVPRKNL